MNYFKQCSYSGISNRLVEGFSIPLRAICHLGDCIHEGDEGLINLIPVFLRAKTKGLLSRQKMELGPKSFLDHFFCSRKKTPSGTEVNFGHERGPTFERSRVRYVVSYIFIG